MLALSDSNLISSSLGTRHRAGLGISETTDATVLIVSEETGIISMASEGKLTRYLDETALRQILGKIYPEERIRVRHSLFRGRKGREEKNDDRSAR